MFAVAQFADTVTVGIASRSRLPAWLLPAPAGEQADAEGQCE